MPASRKYEYRRNLPHYQKSDRPLFVTFRTREDWQLPAQARDIAQRHCRAEHGRTVNLYAGAIMPTHVHLLFMPLRDAEGWPYTLAHIMKLMKGRSAREINKTLQRRGSVWQDEFFDHVLRSDESREAKIQYILQNPVRAGFGRQRRTLSMVLGGGTSCFMTHGSETRTTHPPQTTNPLLL